MSDRLISADKAKEVLKHLLYETAMNNDLDIADIYEDIIEHRLDTWIELIPTVNAGRHGYWVRVADNREVHFVCPYCGEWMYHQGQKYCGECGARLKERKEDETVHG